MKNQEIFFTAPGIAELQEHPVPVPAASPEVYARLTDQKFFPLVQFDWDALGDD